MPVISDPAGAAALGTVLGIWAHPDDEVYLSGALMALARRVGGHVACVTATHGEQGTPDPDRWPPERLALTRRHELAACLAALGVSHHHWLGYRDGACAEVPARSAADRLARIITDTVPDTIVTFGPDGLTGHPDHRAVSRWVTRAWDLAGKPGRLLHATTTDEYSDEFAPEHDRFDVFMDDGLPLRTPTEALALTVAPDDEVLDQKLAALRAQATQTTSLIEAFGEDRYRAWVARETFVDAVAFEATVPVAA